MLLSECNSLKELFELWKEAEGKESIENYRKFHNDNDPSNKRKDNFWIDGFIDNDYNVVPDGYTNSKEKILFVAKECHSNDTVTTKESGYFAHDELKSERNGIHTKNQFLKGIAMLYNAYTSNDYVNPNKDIIPLANAAFMNLNKRGGYASCNWNILVDYVLSYKDYIMREIEIINPDIIICCGPSVKYLLEKYIDTNNRYKKISAYHPSCYTVSDTNKLKFLESNAHNKEFVPVKTTSRPVIEVDKEGIMFDTNNRWNTAGNLEKLMIEHKAICAFGDSRHYLKSLKGRKYVLYYSSARKGVIAIGKIISEMSEEEINNFDKYNADGFNVEPVAPTSFTILSKMLDNEESTVPYVSAKRIKELAECNFCWVATPKYPAIKESTVKKIADELNALWGNKL